MSKITKLHRDSIDKLLDEAQQEGLTECVIVGRTKTGGLIAWYDDNATCATLAATALMLQHDATIGLVGQR